jgi:hypothetical protein
MMRKTLLAVVVTGVLLITLTSCKKNNIQTTKDLLIGNWVQKSYVTDVNQNGINDDSIINMPSGYYMILKSDGKGVSYGNGAAGSYFNWSLSNNDKTLNITPHYVAYINLLDNTTLQLIDTTNGVITWNTLNKNN